MTMTTHDPVSRLNTIAQILGHKCPKLHVIEYKSYHVVLDVDPDTKTLLSRPNSGHEYAAKRLTDICKGKKTTDFSKVDNVKIKIAGEACEVLEILLNEAKKSRSAAAPKPEEKDVVVKKKRRARKAKITAQKAICKRDSEFEDNQGLQTLPKSEDDENDGLFVEDDGYEEDTNSTILDKDDVASVGASSPPLRAKNDLQIRNSMPQVMTEEDLKILRFRARIAAQLDAVVKGRRDKESTARFASSRATSLDVKGGEARQQSGSGIGRKRAFEEVDEDEGDFPEGSGDREVGGFPPMKRRLRGDDQIFGY